MNERQAAAVAADIENRIKAWRRGGAPGEMLQVVRDWQAAVGGSVKAANAREGQSAAQYLQLALRATHGINGESNADAVKKAAQAALRWVTEALRDKTLAPDTASRLKTVEDLLHSANEHGSPGALDQAISAIGQCRVGLLSPQKAVAAKASTSVAEIHRWCENLRSVYMAERNPKQPKVRSALQQIVRDATAMIGASGNPSVRKFGKDAVRHAQQALRLSGIQWGADLNPVCMSLEDAASELSDASGKAKAAKAPSSGDTILLTGLTSAAHVLAQNAGNGVAYETVGRKLLGMLERAQRQFPAQARQFSEAANMVRMMGAPTTQKLQQLDSFLKETCDAAYQSMSGSKAAVTDDEDDTQSEDITNKLPPPMKALDAARLLLDYAADQMAATNQAALGVRVKAASLVGYQDLFAVLAQAADALREVKDAPTVKAIGFVGAQDRDDCD